MEGNWEVCNIFEMECDPVQEPPADLCEILAWTCEAGDEEACTYHEFECAREEPDLERCLLLARKYLDGDDKACKAFKKERE
jgi:hypothetical protein